jgi:hypothetical protein
MVVLVADGKRDHDGEAPGRKTPAKRPQTKLPQAAMELGRQIAESAPPVSDELVAELRLLLHGSEIPAAERAPRQAGFAERPPMTAP